MQQALRVLLVSDDRALCEALLEYLYQYGYHIDIINYVKEEVFIQLEGEQGNYDIALIDDKFVPEPDQTGRSTTLNLLTEVKARYPDIELVLLLNEAAKAGLEALQAGAHRYLIKPVDLDELGIVLQMTGDHGRLKRNANEKQGTEQRAYQLEMLPKNIGALLSTTTLKEVLNKIVENACSVMDTEYSSIFLLDEQTGDFVRATYFPASRKPREGPRKQEGLTAQIISSGQPIKIADAQRDSRVKQSVKDKGVKSIMGVPLKVRDEEDSWSEPRTIGALFVDTAQQREFSNREVDLLQSLANYAAIAIQKVQLFEQTKLAGERFQSAFEASTLLVSSLDLDQVAQNIVEQARKASDATWASLILIDERGHVRNLIRVGSDEYSDVGNIIRPNGLSMRVMNTGKAEPVKDTSQERDRVNPIVSQLGIAAALCLPVSVEGRRVGVIWFHYDQTRPFSQAEVDALQLFVNQAAIAYDNAQRIRELEHMREAVKALSGPPKLPEVLKQIVQSACQVLHAISASILSYDNSRNRFTLRNSVTTSSKFKQSHQVELWQGESEWVMQRGWEGVEDINDRQRSKFLEKDARQLLQRMGVRSFQGVSLTVDKENLGVLYVNYSEPRYFGEDEQKTAQTFANHAALALRNARLLDQVRTRLDVVARISREAADSLEIASLLLTVCQRVEKNLGEKSAIVSIRLLKEENGVEFLVFDPRWHEKFHILIDVEAEKGRTTQSLDEGICGWVAKNKKARNIEDVENPPQGFEYLKLISSTRSELAVPIFYGKEAELVGVLDMQSPKVGAFDEDDQEFLETLAAHLAVAIHKAQLYENLQRRNLHQEAVYKASKAISARVAVGQKQLLDLILKEALELIIPAKGNKAILGVIQLCDEVPNEMWVESIYPPAARQRLGDRVGERRPLDGKKGPIGISGRTILEREAQLVPDVRKDEDYVEFDKRTRSELHVPLIEGGRILGQLGLESDQVAAFVIEDQRAMENLAELAVIAIHNARQYEELERTQEILAARTTVAWIGMVNANWRHNVRIYAATIKGEVENLRTDTSQKRLERIDKKLDKIQQEAQKILDKPITLPLSDAEGVESVLVNELLRERLKQLWENEPYGSVQLILDLKLDAGTTVRANWEWLREVFEILVDNALEAMADVSNPVLMASTRAVGRKVEIVFADRGKGISADILPKLFHEPIKETEGSGCGLLLAKLIANTYGGEIRVESTSPAGTCLVVSLPIEMKPME